MRGNRELECLGLVADMFNQRLVDIKVSESPNQFDHYDLLIEFDKFKNNPAYIEVKERMGKYCEINNFIHYSEEGWMCEQIKWDFLVGKKSRYVNMFNINGTIVMIIWNLNEITKSLEELVAPKNTDFGGQNVRVKKPSVLLTPSKGEILVLNNNNKLYEKINWEQLKNKLQKSIK